jgi:transposase-like protein
MGSAIDQEPNAVYPVVCFDAIVVKVRQDGRVINKASTSL